MVSSSIALSKFWHKVQRYHKFVTFNASNNCLKPINMYINISECNLTGCESQLKQQPFLLSDAVSGKCDTSVYRLGSHTHTHTWIVHCEVVALFLLIYTANKQILKQMCTKYRTRKEGSKYLIQSSHRRAGRRNHVIDKKEERIFRAEMDSLADKEIKLANSEIWRHQILLLIELTDSCFWQFLHDHLQTKQCKYTICLKKRHFMLDDELNKNLLDSGVVS